MEDACLELLREALHRVEVTGVDRGGEPERHGVRALDRLVERPVPVERRHRAEDLLAREVRVVGDVLEDRGRHEVPLAVALAAREDAAALGAAALDRGQHVLHRALVDEGADLRLGIRRVADAAGRDPRQERVAKRLVDVLLDEDPPRRRALLARRPECAGVGRLDGPVELRVRRHDERVVPSELELDAASARRRLVADGVTDGNRPREGDRADVGVGDQLGADGRAGPGQHVEDAGREAGLGEALGDVETGARCLVAELEDDRVAVDEGGCELPHRDRDREVPRRDEADDAERPAHRVEPLERHRRGVDLADRAPRLACGEAQDRRGARRLHSRLPERLAHLRRHVLRDPLGARVDRVRGLREVRGPRRRGEARPAGERGRSRGHRLARVVRARGLERARDLRRPPGVALLVRLVGCRRPPRAADVVPRRSANGCLGHRGSFAVRRAWTRGRQG